MFVVFRDGEGEFFNLIKYFVEEVVIGVDEIDFYCIWFKVVVICNFCE